MEKFTSLADLMDWAEPLPASKSIIQTRIRGKRRRIFPQDATMRWSWPTGARFTSSEAIPDISCHTPRYLRLTRRQTRGENKLHFQHLEAQGPPQYLITGSI